MDKKFETRSFNENDLTDVTHINLTCLPENYNNYFFLNIWRRFPETFLVTTIDGKVTGYIMCRVETGLSGIRFKIARKGHLISLAVLPEYRRHGMGHALLSKAIRNISKYNVNEFYLEVRVSNKPAIELYRSFGLKALQTIRGYYRDGEDAYIMSKPIN